MIPDARVVRTREALQQAMMELLAEQPLESITVRAITLRAGVGYATFFRHFADKDALLTDVVEALTGDFLQQVAPLLRQRDRRAAARSLCAYVEARAPLHKALIAGEAGETVRAGMLRRYLDAVAHASPRSPEGPLDEVLRLHLVAAILNLLAWWLRNLDRVDAETMAELLERLVLSPVGDLRADPPRRSRT
jgi:AcrR family transcriptional regulator